MQSLASQAAVIITNRQLIDDQKKLFDALIQLIAKAIDEKSPYTGNHCRRVPVITKMLATAACQAKQGVFKNYQLSDLLNTHSEESWLRLLYCKFSFMP